LQIESLHQVAITFALTMRFLAVFDVQKQTRCLLLEVITSML
jgi:hypothetical protein